jgi:hypothetical protein
LVNPRREPRLDFDDLGPDEADMSARDRAHDDGTVGACAPLVAGIGVPGVYLTDEVFLYRVAGVAPGEGEEMVELEDCYQLDLLRVPLTALRARRFRVVIPASPEPFTRLRRGTDA